MSKESAPAEPDQTSPAQGGEASQDPDCKALYEESRTSGRAARSRT